MDTSLHDLPDYELLRNARVLVIGASSFIGTHLVYKLLECGAIIHATYRTDRPDFPPEVLVEYLDVTDLEGIKFRLAHFRPDYIFNLAAFVNGSRSIDMVLPTIKANFGGNLNLMLAVAEIPVKRLILMGSMDEYSSANSLPSPPSPYAASKMASSAYAKMFHNLYDLPIVIAKIFMTYGPNQKDHDKLVPYTITSLLKGKMPRFSTGKRMVDWIYVSDVVDGLLKMLVTPGLEGSSVELGTGELVSVRDVILHIFENLNVEKVPRFGALPDRPMEKSVAANVSHTQKLIGWKPSVSIQAGISRTVRWFKQSDQSVFSYIGK